MNKAPQKGVHIVGRTYLNPVDIIKLVASANYTIIYLANGRQYVIALTISKVYEILLPHGQFVRTHKSYVVNLAYVLQLTPTGFLLKNNETIDWARRRREEIKRKFREFIL
jgi:two-component system LytT family response regulator